jgi:hypothetical protein
LLEFFARALYPVLSIVGIVGLIALLVGMPREALIIGVAMVLALMGVYHMLVEAEKREVEKIEIFD